MTTTPNLDLVYMSTNQDEKETVYNNSLDAIDKGLAGLISSDFSSDADKTLTSDENSYLVIKITDTSTFLTTSRNIILSSKKRLHIAWNNTGGGYSLTFKTAAGTGVSVADGEKILVYCDGINIETVAGLQTGQYPLDISHFSEGVNTNSELVYYMPLTRTSVFPSGLTGSFVKAGTASTASAVYSIKKNGTEFATATFAASGTVATLACASDTSFSPGDILSIVAPATADSTLADIGFNLKISSLS